MVTHHISCTSTGQSIEPDLGRAPSKYSLNILVQSCLPNVKHAPIYETPFIANTYYTYTGRSLFKSYYSKYYSKSVELHLLKLRHYLGEVSPGLYGN